MLKLLPTKILIFTPPPPRRAAGGPQKNKKEKEKASLGSLVFKLFYYKEKVINKFIIGSSNEEKV